MNPIMPTFEQYAVFIDSASERISQVSVYTPLENAPNLSARLGRSVFLKREDLQPVFSFKLRGAYNKMAGLSVEEKNQGVITASAGNHAQGVAFSARALSIKATIVMPETTPKIKIDAVKRYGGDWVDVLLYGDSFASALKYSLDQAVKLSRLYVHPYDDEEVIIGQGTVGKELIEQSAEYPMDIVFIPVGGGGLLSGVAVYIKTKNPNIKIIGVESEDSACLKVALAAGERVTLPEVGIFADGVAVAQIGQEPFRIVKEFMQPDDVITVSTDEICAAIKDIFEDTRTLAEPAGALAVAGLKKYADKNPGEKGNWVAIVSGANVNFDRLRHIAERTELGEKREALLAVTIPERPGSFLEFCELLGRRSITEFNYRYADTHEAHVFVGLQCLDRDAELPALMNLLKINDYPVSDLSNDEIAKLHIRYMVGGHTQYVEREELFRVEFPERPGALLAFLKGLGGRWNISLFHYRNHGAAYGRVLVGLQVPVKQKSELLDCLSQLGYPYWEESGSLAYRLFLE